jgi:glycosyltransferase involved in cell wall biosynthesis
MAGSGDPFVRRTARRAAVALATTAQSAERLRALGVRDVRPMSAMGLPAGEIAALGAMPVRRTGPFRMAAVGLLLYWKGFELAIRSLARLRAAVPDAELWIIGDGPERARLASVARGLGLGNSVRFLGGMPRADVLRNLAECDVLVHPSLHDSGGCVCTEALAAGRPVVCLDTGGPALQVTPECGFAVAANSPRQAMDDLALAIHALASNPELRLRMGEAARRRVREELWWDRKGEQLAAIYQEVLGRESRNAVAAGAGGPVRRSG